MIRRALVRAPGATLAAGERTHLARVPIGTARAAAQHAAYVAALEALGVAVTVLPALDTFPDATFVEDALLVFPELSVLTRPGAASRAAEPALIAPHAPADRPCIPLAAGRLDGGDVLGAGRRVFVGLSTRTDAAGAAALAALLEPRGYTVTTVSLADALHLKTAVTALGDDTLVVSRGWLPAPPPGFAVIDADPAEPFGANLLWVNGTALAQAAAPRTAARVAAAGFVVVLVEQDEFAKAEAGLTCLSVLIPDAA